MIIINVTTVKGKLRIIYFGNVREIDPNSPTVRNSKFAYMVIVGKMTIAINGEGIVLIKRGH